MKRYIIKVMGICLMILVVMSNSHYINAASPIKVGMSISEIYDDNKINVCISVSDNPGYAGMQFDLNYDEENLKVLYIEEITSDISIEPIINEKEGKITYVAAEVADHMGDGNILKIEFEIKDINKFEDNDITIEELMVADENINILETQIIVNKEDSGVEQGDAEITEQKSTEEKESDDSFATTDGKSEINDNEETVENRNEAEESDEQKSIDKQEATESSRETVIIIVLIVETIVIIFILVRGYLKRKG